MKFCIDPGHGGSDPGAVGREPVVLEEKLVNLLVSQFLEEELEQLGHWVVMTRRRDRTLGLAPRADFANRLEANSFVSIHANAADRHDAEGIEVFHFPASTQGRVIAESVLTSLLRRFPNHRNRGVKEANFAVLRLTHMPSILDETEFLTNPTQLVFLGDPATQRGIASAIAEGLVNAAV